MTLDAIVIGAGVAGSAAAIRLAAAGARVLLLDRERGPTHKVCGEFISGPAGAHLSALGLDPEAMGGRPIGGLRLVAGARSVECRLPFAAWGLSRYRLDTALRQRAAEVGAQVRLGCAVKRVSEGRVVLAEGESLEAERILLATGKHALAGQPRRLAPKRPMVGFKLHLSLTQMQAARLGGRIELHFFDGGYAGLQPVEEGAFNLSLVIGEHEFAAAGRSFAGVLARIAPTGSLLAERLQSHRSLWPKPLAVTAIPYGFRFWRAPEQADGLWPLGDQAAVIPSFTGDGMAIALASAELAAETILAGGALEAYRKAFRARASRQMAVAGALDALAAISGLRTAAIFAASAMPAIASLAAEATRIAGPVRRVTQAASKSA